MPSTTGNNKISNGLVGSFEFDQCVEQINVLNLRLKNADDRANNLMADLRRVRQVCAEQHLNQHEYTNKLPPPPPPLLLSSSQILLNGNSQISESISLPPLITAPNCKGRTSLARTITQHLNITNGISFGRNSLFGEDENIKSIIARTSLSSSSGAVTPASSLRGGASSPTLPTSPSVSDANTFIFGRFKVSVVHLHLYHRLMYTYSHSCTTHMHMAMHLKLLFKIVLLKHITKCNSILTWEFN